MADISKIKLPNGTTYDIADEYSREQIVDVKSKIEIEEKTASGEIATFDDGGENIPMKSVVCEINPIQDLHGYDHPWVGGGGKNKLPNNLTTVTAFGVTYVTQEDGSIIANGTSTGWANAQIATNLLLKGGEQYILSGIPNVNGAYITIVKANGESGSWSSTYATPSITVSFNEDTLVNVRLSASSGTVLNNAKYKPMIRLASETDPTFEPYSNICPISGRTEVVTQRVGKNLFWIQEGSDWSGISCTLTSEGAYVLNGTTASGTAAFIRSTAVTLKAGTYRLWGKAENNPQNRLFVRIRNATTMTLMTTVTPDNGTGANVSIAEDTSVIFEITVLDSSTLSNTVVYPQLEVGASKSEWEPYNGQTYNIQFKDGDNPLTVYSGTLDLVSGELVVDRAYVDIGSLSWTKQSVNGKTYFRTANAIADAKKTSNINLLQGLLCSNYKEESWAHVLNTPGYDGYICMGWLNKSYIAVNDTRYNGSTANEFKEALDGVQLLYKLATPTTYQLTPTQVKSLLGTNNVWHDCNGDISVTYVKGNLGGYVYGLDKNIENVDTKVENIKTELGTAELQTTDKTIKGAINEIDDKVKTDVPSNAVFTDTKVTSVGNHYTPTEDSSATLSADASSTTAATWNSTSLVTGVDIKRDAKGHVTGVAVDSIKMPINPNTDTHRPIKVNGSQILGNNTAPFNLVSGNNVRMAVTGSGSVTIHADQIDEYAREQIEDVKSNLTELLPNIKSIYVRKQSGTFTNGACGNLTCPSGFDNSSLIFFSAKYQSDQHPILTPGLSTSTPTSTTYTVYGSKSRGGTALANGTYEWFELWVKLVS